MAPGPADAIQMEEESRRRIRWVYLLLEQQQQQLARPTTKQDSEQPVPQVAFAY